MLDGSVFDLRVLCVIAPLRSLHPHFVQPPFSVHAAPKLHFSHLKVGWLECHAISLLGFPTYQRLLSLRGLGYSSGHIFIVGSCNNKYSKRNSSLRQVTQRWHPVVYLFTPTNNNTKDAEESLSNTVTSCRSALTETKTHRSLTWLWKRGDSPSRRKESWKRFHVSQQFPFLSLLVQLCPSLPLALLR